MKRNRYLRILWFFGWTILSIIGWDLILPRLGFARNSRRTRPARLRSHARKFRGLAVQMGGVMIKIGQFLSARLDVLPMEITDELAGLQDEVQPETFETMRMVIEREMKAPLEAHFIEFEEAPLASASIGQVHRARLRPEPGAEPTSPVVIKIQRPDIEAIVETDLSAFRVVSRWINAYPPIRRRAVVPALLDEFSRSLYEEIDYLHEGKNAEVFAENFAGRPDVCVPDIVWSHTTRRMLTMEEIQAIKITDYAAITAAGVDRAEVADRLIALYLQQIFEDRFFHADPHPGNLFVQPLEDGHWRLVFVDFGMTGTITPAQLDALREILIAVGLQDVPRLIRGYQTMGLLLPEADLKTLEKATRMAFERFWGKSTTEIVSIGEQEAAEFAKEFSSLLYELPFQIPENLILLGRCLGILSGLSTGLNPNFNVWNNIMPYARRLVEAEGGGRTVIVDEALRVLRNLAALPGRASALLERIDQGNLEVRIPEIQQPLVRLERGLNRLGGAIIFTAFFAGSIQLYLAEEQPLALASLAAAGIIFIWLVLGGRIRR